jgi:tRNA 2-selenouridine synthase SelU
MTNIELEKALFAESQAKQALQQENEQLKSEIESLKKVPVEYQDIEQTPVAIIGNDFQLLYAQIGSIYEIVKHHKLEVGTLLYALPPAPKGDKS